MPGTYSRVLARSKIGQVDIGFQYVHTYGSYGRSLAPLPQECRRMCSEGGLLSIRHKIDLELRTAYYCRLEPMKAAALSCALVSRPRLRTIEYSDSCNIQQKMVR